VADLTLRIGAEAENVALARRALEGLLAGASPEVIADVNLAVTEACMNAILHGYGDGAGAIDVDARLAPGRVELAVRDYGVGLDSDQGRARPNAGLGLRLIRAVSNDFQIRTAPGRGTEVRIGFRPDGERAPEPRSI
jgi:serine/threonine-protein kinase RsbW